jgi:hydrogenase maturation factor
MRRLEAGPDPVAMLQAALQEAAAASGIGLTVEDGAIFISL